MFQDAAQTAEAVPDWLKIVGLVLSSNLVTAFSTYLFTRPKQKSDIEKNTADAHKSEAEAHKNEADAEKTRVDTVRLLNDELGEVLTEMRGLRKEVEGLEDVRDKLERTIEQIKDGFTKEKSLIGIIVEKAITDLDDVVNNLISRDVAPNFRRKLVTILETLYSIRAKLRTD